MAKILLVEDDKSLREIYGVRLIAEGYEILSAGDGEEALAIAVKQRPDLIVSDVMMPKISGFDMLDILRQTPETKDVKVIMMTALSSDEQRTRGESLGADRYLVKSQVGIEDVIRTVHEVLGDQAGASPQQQPQQQPQQEAQTQDQPAAPVPQTTSPAAPQPETPQQQPAQQPQDVVPPQPQQPQQPAPAPAPQTSPEPQQTPQPQQQAANPVPLQEQSQSIESPADLAARIQQELSGNEPNQQPPANQ